MTDTGHRYTFGAPKGGWPTFDKTPPTPTPPSLLPPQRGPCESMSPRSEYECGHYCELPNGHTGRHRMTDTWGDVVRLAWPVNTHVPPSGARIKDADGKEIGAAIGWYRSGDDGTIGVEVELDDSDVPFRWPPK